MVAIYLCVPRCKVRPRHVLRLGYCCITVPTLPMLPFRTAVSIDGYEEVPADEASLQKAVAHQPVAVGICAGGETKYVHLGEFNVCIGGDVWDGWLFARLCVDSVFVMAMGPGGGRRKGHLHSCWASDA